MTKSLGLMLALVGAALGSGCEEKCSGSYSCPEGTAFYHYTPNSLSAPLAGVSADPPCTAKLFAVDGGPPQIEVSDDAATGTTVCHLHGSLPDGRTATATVTFTPSTVGCCPGFVPSGGDFTLSDGGA
jgi:hypothetical protein